MDPIIQIRNLRMEYVRNIQDENGEREEDFDEPVQKEKITAIRDLTLDIAEGSFTAVIGQNGSGKSTLAKALNGLLLPSAGTVLVNGWDTREEEHIWDIRQTAGMVFQNPDNQLVSSIVEDDVAFGPENLGLDPQEIRERVDAALDSVRMGAYKRQAPHNLSGGQKQRIAIAGVVAMKPRCIIFDEPTAMLDPMGRRDILRIIHQLHEEGITVILITHFMEEAVQAERIVVLNEGEVFMDGSPEEIFREPENLRVINLEVPAAVELAERLRRRGIKVPGDVLTEDKLYAFLCSEMMEKSEEEERTGVNLSGKMK